MARSSQIKTAGLRTLAAFWTVLPAARLPVSTMSMTCVIVAPPAKIVTAITVASRNPSRRFIARMPRIPSARFAKATSSWNGLPAAHPIESATSSARKACAKNPPIPLPATPTASM